MTYEDDTADMAVMTAVPDVFGMYNQRSVDDLLNASLTSDMLLSMTI